MSDLVLVCALLGYTLIWTLFLTFRVRYLTEKAESYHKLADQRLQTLEPLQMTCARFEQRSAFLSERLTKYEERFGQI